MYEAKTSRRGGLYSRTRGDPWLRFNAFGCSVYIFRFFCSFLLGWLGGAGFLGFFFAFLFKTDLGALDFFGFVFFIFYGWLGGGSIGGTFRRRKMFLSKTTRSVIVL